MKKIWIVFSIPLLFACCSAKKSSGSGDPIPVVPNLIIVDYKNLIKSECSFIVSHQLDDGAFIMSSQKEQKGYKINPYFNNLAARALLEDPNQENISAVKKWILWYMNHLNADGSIYDYFASSNTGSASFTAANDFDSIDSYAATFFSLLRRLCEVLPEYKEWLRTYSNSIVQIGKALTLVTDKDGLTIAKPSYPVKYTMDNAEVQEGLTDMIWLSQEVINAGDPNYWQQLQNRNFLAFESDLWNVAGGCYFVSKGASLTNWKIFYPDATCQLYPIWCQMISSKSTRAQSLWKTFNEFYPDWPTGKIYDSGGYPWTLICYVSALMNDRQRTDTYLYHVQSFTDRGIQPTENWYNLEAAFVIFAAKKISQ